MCYVQIFTYMTFPPNNFFRKVKEKPKEVSAAGETPDLVRDCNEVALAEEILAE